MCTWRCVFGVSCVRARGACEPGQVAGVCIAQNGLCRFAYFFSASAPCPATSALWCSLDLHTSTAHCLERCLLMTLRHSRFRLSISLDNT